MSVSSADSGVSTWQIARPASETIGRILRSIGRKSYFRPPPSASARFATGPWTRRSPVATRVNPPERPASGEACARATADVPGEGAGEGFREGLDARLGEGAEPRRSER